MLTSDFTDDSPKIPHRCQAAFALFVRLHSVTADIVSRFYNSHRNRFKFGGSAVIPYKIPDTIPQNIESRFQ